MNEFRFEHLRNRGRLKLPRPVIYVGIAIVLFAFFSAKLFQRADPFVSPPDDTPAVSVPADVPAPQEAEPVPPEPVEELPGDTSEGILFLDGTGQRILPPRLISGQRPEIPAALLQGDVLDSPRVYVRVGKDGLVTHTRLVSSSGSDEVDRLVLDTLTGYTFHPARSAGQPVEFSSVVTVPLRTPEDQP